MATKKQNAMRRRPVVDLTVSTAAPAATGQDIGLPTAGGLAAGSGARTDNESAKESLESEMEENSTDEEGESSEYACALQFPFVWGRLTAGFYRGGE